MRNKKTYAIMDKSNGSIYPRMRLGDILEEINRDRSEDWTDYDETDWLEGLAEFTEFVVIDMPSNTEDETNEK